MVFNCGMYKLIGHGLDHTYQVYQHMVPNVTSVPLPEVCVPVYDGSVCTQLSAQYGPRLKYMHQTTIIWQHISCHSYKLGIMLHLIVFHPNPTPIVRNEQEEHSCGSHKITKGKSKIYVATEDHKRSSEVESQIDILTILPTMAPLIQKLNTQNEQLRQASFFMDTPTMRRYPFLILKLSNCALVGGKHV